MTTEEAQKHAATIHQMATEIVQSFRQDRNLHPPLTTILSLFAAQMMDLTSGKLPTTTIEAAKVLYLTTLISSHTLDEVAAAYIEINAANNTDTVAE